MVNLEVGKDTNVTLVKRHLVVAKNLKSSIKNYLMNTAMVNRLSLKLQLKLGVVYPQFRNI